jgi:hypothetical protein
LRNDSTLAVTHQDQGDQREQPSGEPDPQVFAALTQLLAERERARTASPLEKALEKTLQTSGVARSLLRQLRPTDAWHRGSRHTTPDGPPLDPGTAHTRQGRDAHASRVAKTPF